MIKGLRGAALILAILIGRPALGVEPTAPGSPLPPLTEPPTHEVLTGKFVWGDLFTSDVELSRAFYERLLGWQWVVVSEPPRSYGMLYADGVPVAGIVHRAPTTGSAGYGRWVHYVSVEDVSAAQQLTERSGGRVLLNRQQVADRGEFAVVADPDSAIFGLMRSTSGDPGDYRVAVGEWLWYQLFTRNPTTAAGFYKSLAGYSASDRPDSHNIVDLVLASTGYARASIGALSEESKASPTWVGFVRVAEVGPITARVRELGGEVLYESTTDVSDIAIIADPNGATLGLLQWDYPEQSADPESSDPVVAAQP
jgi:predicted enzyme related to lactoylglutathione lyase